MSVLRNVDYWTYAGFLTPHERESFAVWADFEVSAWEPGRQGTGYHKCSIKHEGPWPTTFVIDRALWMLGIELNDPGMYDAYLLWYPPGSHIPVHRDEATMYGKRHKRLNAIVRQADWGGEFRISDQLVQLGERDAVIFWPDQYEHSVSECATERLVLSIGAWV